MSEVHSRYAPSSMSKIVKCYGFVQMTEGEEEVETEEQREGSAAHWVGQSMLLSCKNQDPKIFAKHYVGEVAPNGVIITDEMYDAALCYYNVIMRVAGKDQGILIPHLHIEERLELPEIHEESYGTPDCWLFDTYTLTLYMWDFKYGFLKVKVENNWQLDCYDLGALNLVTKNNGLAENNIKVINTIVQPRNYDGSGPATSATFVDTDLRASVNIMNAACIKSESDDPEVSSGSHCIGCAAQYKCQASLQSTANVLDYSACSTPVEMTPEGIAYELNLLKKAKEIIKFREEAMMQVALSRFHKGSIIPGFRSQQGYTKNKWKHSPEQIISMGQLLGVDLKEPVKAQTPHQAQLTLTRLNIDPDVIKSMFGKTTTSIKLVSDDGSKAQQIFSQEKI